MVMGRLVKSVVSFLIAASLCCAFCFAAEPVRIFFPASRTGEPVLPVDSVIGQTAGASSSEFHILVSKALRSPYSFEWTEKYLREDVRAALTRLYGPWLSENLPASSFLLSAVHENGDGSTGMNIRINGACFAIVVSGGQIVSVTKL